MIKPLTKHVPDMLLLSTYLDGELESAAHQELADHLTKCPLCASQLAALQSLVDPEAQLELDGLSDQAWRERIGNAVPPAAARAIAGEIGRTLLLAWTGQTFALGSTPIWVRPMVAALAVAREGGVA